jgi:hypothetical protein
MRRLFFLPVRSLSLASVGVGMASAYALSKWGRPMLVETLKLGYEAKDGVSRVLSDARARAGEVAAEAQAEARKPRPAKAD